jgi:hypothetical protein
MPRFGRMINELLAADVVDDVQTHFDDRLEGRRHEHGSRSGRQQAGVPAHRPKRAI